MRDNAGTLEIVARGPQVHVMPFEIHVLAIVNELYFRHVGQAGAIAEGRRRLAAKVELLREFGREPARRHPFEFFDFGVRRRFSAEWQREVVATLAREVPEFFKGTSNVLLARDLNLVPIGTMAHEYLQTYQALGVRLRDFQKAALESWVQEYRGDLGTALTDVVGMDAFLADFDLYFAKLFDGLRHDSGDPVVRGEKALAHYDGRERTARLTPSRAPEDLGLTNLRREIGVSVRTDRNGAVVTSVVAGSAADRRGIEPGDRLYSVNNERIAALEDLNRVFEASFGRSSVVMVVVRGGVGYTLTFWLE